jgi:hypothetical protein
MLAYHQFLDPAQGFAYLICRRTRFQQEQALLCRGFWGCGLKKLMLD